MEFFRGIIFLVVAAITIMHPVAFPKIGDLAAVQAITVITSFIVCALSAATVALLPFILKRDL